MFHLLLSSFFSLEFKCSRPPTIAKEVWSWLLDRKDKYSCEGTPRQPGSVIYQSLYRLKQ